MRVRQVLTILHCSRERQKKDKKEGRGDCVMQGGCVGPRMQYTNKSFPAIYTVSHANALPRASKRCLPVLTRMLYIRRGGGKKKSRGEGRANVLKNGTKKKKHLHLKRMSQPQLCARITSPWQGKSKCVGSSWDGPLLVHKHVVALMHYWMLYYTSASSSEDNYKGLRS